MSRLSRLLLACLLVLPLTLAPACTRVENPATGAIEYTALSPEDERQIGQEQHPRLLVQFGGAYDDPALRAYVDELGQKLARVSELPELDFTFTLLDSEVVNAFALPGGYVYITRGLLALAENEAEVAGVLGHEIGHVTARHSAQRVTQAQTTGILATLGTIGAAILGGEAAGQLAQQAFGAGAQAWLASYSRDQELEADRLGVRYLIRAGYDPEAMATFLAKLGEHGALERRLAGAREAGAFERFMTATHPRTLERVQQVVADVGGAPGGRLGRAAYLERIDGMIWGENPNQGLVRGRAFIHPALRFAFEAPDGFRLQNTAIAVIGGDREGRRMIFRAAPLEGAAPVDYVRGEGLRRVAETFEAEVSRPRGARSFTVDGMAAASVSATLRKGRGTADVGLAVIEAGDRAYEFVFLSRGSMSRGEARAYQATVDSFRRLAPEEAARHRPLRIRIAGVGPGEGAARLAARMDVEEAADERFAILNRLAVEAGLTAGERVKLVAAE